jgi:putative hydrolase of the HAD superfamily
MRFFYFDLGNVLLTFDHGIACRKLAALANTTPALVRMIVFDTDLQWRYERGEITTHEFAEHFCRETGTRADIDQLERACAEIFELHVPIVPLVAQLKAAGHRLGILSNTCAAHWQYVFDGRYRILRELFEVYALSYELKSMKPEPQIYQAAAAMAGVAPQDIFFTDDRLDNVQGALAAGYDAVPFVSAQQLQRDLHRRGVRLNY